MSTDRIEIKMLVTAYRNGATAGSPPPPRDHSNDVRRKAITGWTAGAVRRHTKWLYTVNAPELATDIGVAVTLTLRDCPADPAAWIAMRRALFKRLERVGMVRAHWVTEWQRRRVPHMHCAIYFPAPDPGAGAPETQLRPGSPALGPERVAELARAMAELNAQALPVAHWLQVAKEHGAAPISQDVKLIDGATGWLQYLSKHASRGVNHYQRYGHPDGWETTGRLWGKLGEWPTDEPMKFDMSQAAGWRYRRLVRSWAMADARASGIPSRIAWTRRMLSCNDPRLSPVRGVSQWQSEDVTLAFVGLLADEGHLILQRDD